MEFLPVIMCIWGSRDVTCQVVNCLRKYLRSSELCSGHRCRHGDSAVNGTKSLSSGSVHFSWRTQMTSKCKMWLVEVLRGMKRCAERMESGRGSYFRRAVWQGDILADPQNWSDESHLDIWGSVLRGRRQPSPRPGVGLLGGLGARRPCGWSILGEGRRRRRGWVREGRGMRSRSDGGLITASMWACGGLGI